MQLCTKTCFSSLDVSEMFTPRISSMYNVVMHDLNSFLSSSIRNLILPSFSRLFTIKIDVFAPFTNLNSHSSLSHKSNY